MSGRFTLRLAKEDFKFSAAHFTVFGDGEAEPLHGHNYRVSAALSGPALDDLDFLVPAAAVKADIRAHCAALDEKILLPEHCPYLELARCGETMNVVLGSRRYDFPASEVVLLPVRNVTIEALARLLQQRFAEGWAHIAGRVETVEVTVAETRGQSASCHGRLLPGP